MPIVVKTVLQTKQELNGVALIVKPYEESMEKDNCDYEVFHNWCDDFYNFSWLYKRVILGLFAPAGFWPRGQNPRRHPKSPRVYTYKDKEYLLKK